MKNDFFRRLVMGRIGLLLLFLISTMYVQAQGVRNVSGMIKDASGDPLIGVNVTVKGDATLGTISDMDGEYSLKIPREKVTMVFSFIGYDFAMWRKMLIFAPKNGNVLICFKLL